MNTPSRKNHRVSFLRGIVLSAFLAVCAVVSADSDLPSETIVLYSDDVSSDFRQFNEILETFALLVGPGTFEPDFSQIDPALIGWVQQHFQNWVDAGSTAYEEGFLVILEWKFDDIPYRDVYYISSGNAGNHVQASILSRGNPI